MTFANEFSWLNNAKQNYANFFIIIMTFQKCVQNGMISWHEINNNTFWLIKISKQITFQYRKKQIESIKNVALLDREISSQ